MEIIDFMYILVFIFIMFILKSWSMNKIHGCTSCSEKNINSKPLYDIIHINVPNLKHEYWIGDFLVILLLLLFIYKVVLYKLDIVNIIMMFIALQILKSITSMVTILPDPSGMCENKHGGSECLKLLFGNCNDLMFSGHAGFAFLCLMILYPHVNIITYLLLLLYVLILCIVTILTCNHYTIDVIMAFFVSYFIYNTMSK